MNIKKWKVSELNKEDVIKLAQELQVPSFLAMMLCLRGITTAKEAESFFGEETEKFDPFSLPDMEKAVNRIHKALDAPERIGVFGDYDADGLTATSMLYLYLESCGADVTYYIPERETDGYGLNNAAIDSLYEMGVKLIVTVDNGISSVDETLYAKSLGIDVIITDHHRPQEVLPDAIAVVDAYRDDCTAPYIDFSGAGIAYQLINALEGVDGAEMIEENYADLAAIGTIGDVVPLNGENRKLVRVGVRNLIKTDKPGLHALIEKNVSEGRELTAETVAFSIVPYINASGRVSSAKLAAKLLICQDDDEARDIADEIIENNGIRRGIEKEIFDFAMQKLEASPSLYYDRVIVIDGENWHQGVMGIVASRLCERFGKPCIILSRDGDFAKGSGRSVNGFSLFEAIKSCGDILVKYGGHTMAAGLVISADKIREFRKRINEYAKMQDIPDRELLLDCKLNPQALSPQFPMMLRSLEPFGSENPKPVFGLYGMTIREMVPVGGGKHLKILLQKNDCILRCIRFGVDTKQLIYKIGDTVDAAVQLGGSSYKGEETLEIIIRDMRLSDFDDESAVKEWKIYESLKRGDELLSSDRETITPQRDDFALLYRFLRANGGYNGSITDLLMHSRFGKLGKLLTALDAFAQSKLIDLKTDTVCCEINMQEVSGKTDLEATDIMKQLIM